MLNVFSFPSSLRRDGRISFTLLLQKFGNLSGFCLSLLFFKQGCEGNLCLVHTISVCVRYVYIYTQPVYIYTICSNNSSCLGCSGLFYGIKMETIFKCYCQIHLLQNRNRRGEGGEGRRRRKRKMKKKKRRKKEKSRRE